VVVDPSTAGTGPSPAAVTVVPPQPATVPDRAGQV